jgi:hypothetical protein
VNKFQVKESDFEEAVAGIDAVARGTAKRLESVAKPAHFKTCRTMMRKMSPTNEGKIRALREDLRDVFRTLERGRAGSGWSDRRRACTHGGSPCFGFGFDGLFLSLEVGLPSLPFLGLIVLLAHIVFTFRAQIVCLVHYDEALASIQYLFGDGGGGSVVLRLPDV